MLEKALLRKALYFYYVFFYFRISNIDPKIFDEKKLLCHIQNLKELLNRNVKIVEALSKLELCLDDEITDEYLQAENNDTLQL